MANVFVPCPQCSTRYRLDEAFRGKKAMCKKCGIKFAIGGPSISTTALDLQWGPALA